MRYFFVNSLAHQANVVHNEDVNDTALQNPVPYNLDYDLEPPCPTCGRPMTFTGLPDIAGPIHVRFFRCEEHGLVMLDADGEVKEGWG